MTSGDGRHPQPRTIADRREATATLHRARRFRAVMVQIPFVIVVIFVAVAVVFLVLDRWRRGAFVFGAGALLAALLRAVLPTARVGLLQVRGRFFDVSAMVITGAAILWLATSIDPLGTD